MAQASPKPAPPPFDVDQRMLRVAVLVRQVALGLAQQDICEQTGVSEARLSRFLSGREKPSDQTVNRLVHWLELPLTHFNRVTEPAEPAPALPAA
jgi:transcriptional regulator with XRE-family HTH domain